FMLYILFMIVTLKPGIQPLHTGDTLLSIIQNNFIESITLEITKVPLNAKVKSTCLGLPNVNIPFPFDWTREKTKMVNKNNQNISFNIQSSNLIFDYAPTADSILREYYLLNSEEFSGSSELSGGCSDSMVLEYIYGVPELLTGLSQDKIDSLDAKPYEQLKEELNYPLTNDFNITINNGASNEISSGRAPPTNANVYVKQFTDFILEDTGEKVPVTVTIKVW
ncbi:MAG: hypothetical protein KKD48_05890, partial [Nanoarchaeota archaeon]|nr:hypothetical protein [Nanoarchaeota archaeon]